MWHQTRTVTLLCEIKDKIESVGLAHVSFLDSTKLAWEKVKELASGESVLGGGQHTGCSWSSLSWSMRVNYLFIVTMNSLEGGGCRAWCLQCPLAGGHTDSVAGVDRPWSSNTFCFRPIHCLDPFQGLWRAVYSQSVLFLFQNYLCDRGTKNLHPPGSGWWRNQSGSWRRQLQNRGSQLGGGTSEQTIPLLPWKKELEHEHLLKAEWSNVRLQKHRAGSTLLSSLPPSLTEPGGWVTLGHSKNSLGEGGERGRNQAHSSCSSNEGSHRHYVIPTTAIHWEIGVGGGGSGIGYS